jgi:hypothetical protein
MSHKLQIGEMKVPYLSDQEIWGHFNYIFSSKSRNSTTYKFVLIKSLLENLYNVNEKLELSYTSLFSSFAKIYWNLVIHHNLNQINMLGKRSEVQNILLSIQHKQQLPSEVVFDKLSYELQLLIIQRVMKKCKINVMGAIYGDTQGTIYDFDNEIERLKINPSFYSFMQRSQRVLTYLANYHLALFLEKFNEAGDTHHLLLKVENVSKRSSLDPFYQLLTSYYQNTCFYCGKQIKKKDSAHVDHFIPWSFVQTDHLWNLVISCNVCNLSKSDKLAEKYYLEALIDRNSELITHFDVSQRNDMKIYSSNKLESMYKYSIQNGYTDFWIPKKRMSSDSSSN